MKSKRMQFVKKALLLAGAALAALAVPASPASAQVEYYHLDAVGNVRAVTDQDQNVVARHDYLPFGEECTTGLCASNPGIGSDDPRRFTGKERDSETGLDYFGARYYRANSGRFTAVDPVMTTGANLTNPQGWNRYANSLNNPLRYRDPDGRAAVPVVVWVAAEVGLAIHDTVDAYATVTNPEISPAVKAFTVAATVIGIATVGGGYGKAGREAVEQLGDLTTREIQTIQAVVDGAGRPLEVVGSAARGTRRGVGTDLPIGKGPGTKSDIDYLVPPSSAKHHEGSAGRLPDVDPRSGIISGVHNPHIGPGVRFEPNAKPTYVPEAGR